MQWKFRKYQGHTPYNRFERRNAHYPPTALLRRAKISRSALSEDRQADGDDVVKPA